MFARQWFHHSSQAGLHPDALELEICIRNKDYNNCWEILKRSKSIWPEFYHQRQTKRVRLISERKNGPLRIGFRNFWPFFEPSVSTIGRIFIEEAKRLGKVAHFLQDDDEVDILISSCFSSESQEKPVSAVDVFYSGENVRPLYSHADYSFTTDTYSYSDRNAYLPVWFAYACEYSRREGPIDIQESLNQLFLRYGEHALPWHERRKTIAFVGNNMTPLRCSTINYLRSAGWEVLEFGSHSKPLQSKEKLYGSIKYVFCPENSMHPGYMTEKILDALASGSVALYWGGYQQSLINASSNQILVVEDDKSLPSVLEVHSRKNLTFNRLEALKWMLTEGTIIKDSISRMAKSIIEMF